MRFYGAVGFATSSETAPGVWSDTVVEHNFFGTIIKNARQLQNGQDANPDVVVSNSISIVASEFASEHILDIRYVRWLGVLWTVTYVDVQRPRLVLNLGEVYNGPTP